MKKLLTLILFFSATLFAQAPHEAFVYINANKLGFYDFDSKTNFEDVYTLVDFANQVYHYNNRFFVVSSGNYTDGYDALQIFPDQLFTDYITNQDTMIFKNGAMVIPLETFGNAYTVVGISDSTALVTLAGTGHVQVVNYVNGTVQSPIADGVVGNPQGTCDFNSEYAAVAMADWYAGVGNSVRLFNKTTHSFDYIIETRLNTVDMIKLFNGDLVSWSWGTWSGAENYGTLDFIDKDSLAVKQAIMFPDSMKAGHVIQIDNSTLYVNGFLSNFSLANYLVNLNNYSAVKQTEGFFSKTILGKLLDGSYVVGGNSGLEFYTSGQVLTDSLNWVFPMSWASAVIPEPNGVAVTQTNPVKFTLQQNYPNPFSKGEGAQTSTMISFSVPVQSAVKLTVYNSLGQQIAVLVNQTLSGGNYNVRFNPSAEGLNLSSGVYFYSLQSGKLNITKKMIILR